MSERQEHRQRLNARIAYAAAIERWAKNQPSRIYNIILYLVCMLL